MKIRLVMKSFRSMLVENTPELIEEVKADVSKIFNGFKCDVEQNCENLKTEFIE